MKIFLKNLFIFFLFLFLFTEIVARIFHISTDAPKTFRNKNKNINYYPNQEGYWDGGRHKWYINNLGYMGKNLPKSFDNLFLLIGDSYIQNIMNPDSCRQREYLSKLQPKYNFMEVSMAGLNLLGYFEYSKPMDSLKPIGKIIYVSTGDFLGNISKKKMNHNSYKVNLNTGKIYYPKYRGSYLKDIIYNFKFIYFLYRKHLLLFNNINDNKEQKLMNKLIKENGLDLSNKDLSRVSKLLDFIKENYNYSNVLFVFQPFSNHKLIELTKSKGFHSFELKKEKKINWKTEKDGHWSCFGHKEVAKQVSVYIDSNKFD